MTAKAESAKAESSKPESVKAESVDKSIDTESPHDLEEAGGERRQLFRTFAYLAGRQGSTAVLGLAYWVFVTHYFGAAQVGLAFAASSTALLLSTLGILGIATFLIAEMGGMDRATQRPVLSTGIAVSGAAVAVLAVGTIALSPYIGKSLAVIGRNPLMAALFVMGSVATVAAAHVRQRRHRDPARRRPAHPGDPGLAHQVRGGGRTDPGGVSDRCPGSIFAYGAGIIVSLGVCYPMLRLARSAKTGQGMKARVALTRKYGALSLNHHVLNLSINSVSYLIPVIAALVILPSQYAYFATAQTVASIVLIIPYLLTMALFAETSNDPELLHRHVRRTLPLGAASALAIVAVVMAGAPLVLQVFGHAYAVHGTTALRTLVLAGPSYVMKDHYVAIRRSQGRLLQASRGARHRHHRGSGRRRGRGGAVRHHRAGHGLGRGCARRRPRALTHGHPRVPRGRRRTGACASPFTHPGPPERAAP